MSQPSFDAANESANAWDIRDEYSYRDFAEGEEELRKFLAARV